MSTARTKANIRDAYRSFAERFHGVDFADLTEKQRSYALTRFYVTEIHNRLHPLISDDDFDLGYVDNAGDLGADFVHRDDHTVWILQSKYLKPNGSSALEPIIHFQTLFTRLFEPRFRANRRLQDVIADIDLATDTFVVRFLNLGRFAEQAAAQTSEPPQLPSHPADLADRITYEFLAESDLTEEYRYALSVQGGIPGESILIAHGKRGRRTPVIELEDGITQSCVLVVAASQVLQLYRDNKESLFTLNIRNYIGSTATNKAILLTASDRPEAFFQFNNGISCLAESFVVADDGSRVTAKGLQVVNGAQTVKALVRAGSRKRWAAGKEPLLLVRLTAVARGYGADARFRNELIRANNTQNVIKASDFRSNDPVQNDLVRRFSDYKRFGKSVQYVPKRTDVIRPNAFVIELEEFSKLVYSFVRNPIGFSGSTSFLFDDSDAGGYKWVFGDGTALWDVMPEAEFRLRSALWWMGVEFSERVKRDRQGTADPIAKAALERKWWLFYASKCLLERSFGDEYRQHLERHYRGEWRFDEEARGGKWFGEIYQKARDSLVYVYSQSAKADGFVHRNWMRSETSVGALRDFIRTAPIDPVPAPS